MSESAIHEVPSFEQSYAPRVFISYTHDSETHKEAVLSLADRLINEGVDCHLDRYYETPPPDEGWPLWMERQIESADFVLVACTPTYLRRFRREEDQGSGLGAQWEGASITQHLYNTAAKNKRFLPVGFKPYHQAKEHIPLMLQATNYYDVATDDGYDRLYRHLTRQPQVERPSLGQRRVLHSRSPITEQPALNGQTDSGTQSTFELPRKISPTPTDSVDVPTTESPVEIPPAELRRRMTERLNRGDVAVIWFDLFGTILDNDLPGRPLAECIIELLAKVNQRQRMEALLEMVSRSYSYLLTP